MIFTLLGSLIGFVSSSVPQVLKFFQQRQDNTQELAILDRQLEQHKLLGDQKLQEITVGANLSEIQSLHVHDSNLKSSGWIEALRASVRPVLTYAFFVLFAYVKIVDAQQHGIQAIWDEPTQVLFAAVVSFWFGSRTVTKLSR